MTDNYGEKNQEELTDTTPALSLPIEDKELLAVINAKLTEATGFYDSQLNLKERRETNEKFWLGKHYDETLLDSYQIPYKDNIIYQDLEQRIAIATSRMPDIIIAPPKDDAETMRRAHALKTGLELKITDGLSRRIIKDALRNHHLYFTGIIKVRWDKNLGEQGEDGKPIGDFIFEAVRPHRVVADHRAFIPHDGYTADKMDFISEWVEKSVGEVLFEFPEKREEIMKELAIVRGTGRQMASKMRYQEIWFTWYGPDGPIEGVCWKYRNLILKKMRNPYWDDEGVSEETDELHLDEDDVLTNVKKTYFNFFNRSRKPYIFLTYQNLGRCPIDETTPVEQAIPLQRMLNKQGRIITEISERAIPKLGFAGRYITKEAARRVTNDPNDPIWLEDAENVNDAIMSIPAQPPSQALFQAIMDNRNQIDSKFSTHATTRGERVPQESGVSKQITREGDLTASDDIASIIVERTVSEMAGWGVQMMKMFYTKSHFIRDLGPDGELVSIEMKRDSIDDGIFVNVKSSSVDKQQRRLNALSLASTKTIDPYSMMEDLDLPNPKERTKRLLAFLAGNFQGYAEMLGVTIENPQQVPGQAPPQAPGSQPAVMPGETPTPPGNAQADIARLSGGEDIEPPAELTPDYLKEIIAFVNSPEFENLPNESKGAFSRYVSRLRQGGGETNAPA